MNKRQEIMQALRICVMITLAACAGAILAVAVAVGPAGF